MYTAERRDRSKNRIYVYWTFSSVGGTAAADSHAAAPSVTLRTTTDHTQSHNGLRGLQGDREFNSRRGGGGGGGGGRESARDTSMSVARAGSQDAPPKGAPARPPPTRGGCAPLCRHCRCPVSGKPPARRAPRPHSTLSFPCCRRRRRRRRPLLLLLLLLFFSL